MPDGLVLTIQTPRVFLPLLKPARYKGLRGGRGGGKSHYTAERLIEECATEHHRVACLREYQSSMAESVKQLLEDKIQKLGVSDIFRITDTEIRGPFDSLIVFKGLRTSSSGRGSSAFNIRSLEGFSRAWVEEAQFISANSIRTMTPTFRRTPGMVGDPEMYFTWNPKRRDDPIEVLFNNFDPELDADSYVLVNVSYRDNPWFKGSKLEPDMERAKRRDPDEYANVWLGEYENLSQSRVFRNWRVAELETPDDARFYFGADWGFSHDPTVLIRCWIRENQKTKIRTLLIDYEAYQVGCKITDTPALFDQVPGSRKWPIRADSARPETIDYMKDHFNRLITPAVKGKNSVVDGIEFLKSYDIVIHPRCERTIDEFSRYSYKIDPHTDEVLPILSDDWNHCIDSARYAVEGKRLAPGMMYIPDSAMQRSRIPVIQRRVM